jgi:hypothetical protein
MRVVLAMEHLTLGGIETYAVTVAEQLERLGHQATIHAADTRAEARELVASRGLRLTVGDAMVPEDADAVIAQDAASAYLLAGRAPDATRLFVMHALFELQNPPKVLDPPAPVVVLNDRIARRAAALASEPHIVRMRQPIDIERFRPRSPPRRRARRVLSLGNRLRGARLRVLRDACDDLGLDLVQTGHFATAAVAPDAAIADADIVVGYGRSILDAMAMGRAAYVWDHGGGDGWVTPESYAALEADGFSGGATDRVVDGATLRADLAGYRMEWGELGFDLVRLHHSAAKHAEALVGLIDGGRPRAPHAPYDELVRLVRAESRATYRADGLALESLRLREELEALRVEAAAAHDAAAAEVARRVAAEELLSSVVGSRSWRTTAALRRAGAYLRRR